MKCYLIQAGILVSILLSAAIILAVIAGIVWFIEKMIKPIQLNPRVSGGIAIASGAIATGFILWVLWETSGDIMGHYIHWCIG
jgi:hypothetical protein